MKMTKSCVVCKKESVPGDKTRSLHKFPHQDDLKQKWMQAVGVLSVSKNACVCSDHFDNQSYHQTDGYTSVRRILLANAVPTITITKALSNITNDLKPETSSLSPSQNMDIVERNDESTISMITNVPITDIKLECTDFIEDDNISNTKISDAGTTEIKSGITSDINNIQTVDNINNAKFISANTICLHDHPKVFEIKSEIISDSNNSSNSMQRYQAEFVSELHVNKTNVNECDREKTVIHENHNESLKTMIKLPINDMKNYSMIKKFRFMDGFKTEYITRADFVSDDAWYRFLKFTAYKNSLIEAHRKKNWRSKKKINQKS